VFWFKLYILTLSQTHGILKVVKEQIKKIPRLIKKLTEKLTPPTTPQMKKEKGL